MRTRSLAAVSLLIGLLPSFAADTPVDGWAPEPYRRLAEAVSAAPGSPSPMAHLTAAVDALSDVVPGLTAEVRGAILVLRHPSRDTPLATLRLRGPADLPSALHGLEQAVGPVAPRLDDRALRHHVLNAVARAGDRWARVLDRVDLARLDEVLAGREGDLGVEVVVQDAGWIVRQVEADGPAAAAGLRPGDRLATLDGWRPADGASPTALLRGPLARPVLLDVVPSEGPPRRVLLSRRANAMPAVSVIDLDPSRAVVRVDTLGPPTAPSLRAILATPGVRDAADHCLALDLRGLPGGTVQGAVETLDVLLPAGSLGRLVRDGEDAETWSATTDGTEPGGRLVALVDGRTASAAEWLADVIAARGGFVVGGPTFGKDAVQEPHPIGDGFVLRRTVGHLEAPGASPPEAHLDGRAVSDGRIDPTVSVVFLREDALFDHACGAGLPDAVEVVGPPVVRRAAPTDDGLEILLQGPARPSHLVFDAPGTPLHQRLAPWAEGPGPRSVQPWPAPADAALRHRLRTDQPITTHLLADGHPDVVVGPQVVTLGTHPHEARTWVVSRTSDGLVQLDGPAEHPSWTVALRDRRPPGPERALVSWPDGVARALLPLPDGIRTGLDIVVQDEDHTVRHAIPLGAIGATPTPWSIPVVRAPGASLLLPTQTLLSWPLEVEGDGLALVVLRAPGTVRTWVGTDRVREDVAIDGLPGGSVEVTAETAQGLRITRSWRLQVLPPPPAATARTVRLIGG